MPETYPLGRGGSVAIVGGAVWLPMGLLSVIALLGGLWMWGLS